MLSEIQKCQGEFPCFIQAESDSLYLQGALCRFAQLPFLLLRLSYWPRGSPSGSAPTPTCHSVRFRPGSLAEDNVGPNPLEAPTFAWAFQARRVLVQTSRRKVSYMEVFVSKGGVGLRSLSLDWRGAMLERCEVSSEGVGMRVGRRFTNPESLNSHSVVSACNMRRVRALKHQ